MHLPYCGTPPSPGAIVFRWNLDPVLLLALLGILLIYRRGAGAGGGVASWRRLSFHAGWSITALALVSPLCALSVSLFSARIAQHMILVLAAAPLLALGRPLLAARCALNQAQSTGDPRSMQPYAMYLAPAIFAVALWYWHAPEPYLVTFESTLVYWTMHLTVFLPAVWLWDVLLNRSPSPAQLLAATLSMLQMSLLGALITLAPTQLYAPHTFTTAVWGLSPLEDQQLGGVIMWAGGAAIFFLLAVAIGARLLARPPASIAIS